MNSLLAEWKSDPSKRPPPRKKGQDAKGQAHALCTAAYNKSVANSLSLMLEGGNGTTFIGAAATNRPYIPHLKPTKVIDQEDGEKMLLVHLANSGHFNHPTGAFTLNRVVFSLMIQNHKSNVLGQDSAYDCRHRPDDGAYGWFEDLLLGDQVDEGEKEFWGLVKPTPVGLERIESGEYRYSSMEFHRNFERDDVVLNLEDVTDEDLCLIDPGAEEEAEEDMGKENDEKVTLELEAAKAELAKLEAEREAEKKAAEEKILEAEKLALEAEQRALKLQQEAIDSEATAVVELAKAHRDEDGNALPRQFLEWASKFLKFEDIGEDKGIVQLEEETEVPNEVQRYCIAAVRSLVLSMPGVVPAKQKSQSGEEEPNDDEDDFDFDGLWEEE